MKGQDCSSLVASINKRDVTCYGGSDGTAFVSVSGGIEPYNYEWSHGMGLRNATPDILPSGRYTCMITDAAGCTTEAGISIEDSVLSGLQVITL